ncbi:hypothetical protein [Streptomyces sp. NPDC018045]|uniref:hypothetical protein n=1 Tax=Streptomyces sp. NPDC018045 TaxID=3365037 RepID=UPI003799FA28
MAFGGASCRSPLTGNQVEEYARTCRRPTALSGGFELCRVLDKDVRDAVTATPVRVPALVMTAQGQLDALRTAVGPRMTSSVRAVDVPRAGHWRVEENPRFGTAEPLAFLGG